jgi:GT2 family glycosyltransferase
MINLSNIIVSWNAKEYLDECLQSIEKNAPPFTFETIVVDNASTDGAPELVEKKYPQVHLIRNAENLGFAKANNIAIEQSKGKYICLINSDAVVLKDCLDLMCRYMDDHPEIGVLGPKVLNRDGSLQPTCREFPTFWKNICHAMSLNKLFPKSSFFSGYTMMNWAHDTVLEVDFLSGCFMMVRKSAIEQVGPLDDNFFFYGEDKDWCKRFWKAGWKVVYFPHAEAIHYLYGSSDKDPVKLYIQQTKANLQYYSKHCNFISKMGFVLTNIIHQLVRVVGYSLLYLIKSNGRETSLLKIKRSYSCLLWLFNSWY